MIPKYITCLTITPKLKILVWKWVLTQQNNPSMLLILKLKHIVNLLTFKNVITDRFGEVYIPKLNIIDKTVHIGTLYILRCNHVTAHTRTLCLDVEWGLKLYL